MNGVYLRTLIFIWATWTGTQPLQWLDDLDDNIVKYVCTGDDLHLLWNFTLPSDEEVASIHWFYRGLSEELVGTVVHNSFEPTATFGQRVEFVPAAGMVLKQIVPSDKGNYSVEITAHANSRYVTDRRSVTVEITEPPSTDSGHLEVRQDRVAVYDNGTDQWSVQLSCGNFTHLGHPPVHVVWTTPSGNALQSSSFKDGNFHLLLPDSDRGGNYTCSLPSQTSATSCLPSSSPLLGNFSVTVHECAAHLAVCRAHRTDLQTGMELLRQKESNQTDYIHSLEEKVQNLTQQVQHYSGMLQQSSDPICGGGYTVLDDYTRDVNYWDGSADCDRNLTPGWYRFLIHGTNAVIPTSCISENHCGTAAPVWLDLQNGGLPEVGQEHTVRACASYDNDCCNWPQTSVTVRNCGAFFVYKLNATHPCSLGYCATNN